MFSSSGGGGFPMPRMDNPVEIIIVLVVLGVIAWVAFRAINS